MSSCSYVRSGVAGCQWGLGLGAWGLGLGKRGQQFLLHNAPTLVALFSIFARLLPGKIHRMRMISGRSHLARQMLCLFSMARDHRKLDAFKLADQLAMAVYQTTAEFPASERYGLRSQLRRAAVSTATNIVEGCARESQGDYLRFLDIALGSAREVLYLASLATRLAFLEKGDAIRIEKLGDRVAGSIFNLRKSLKPSPKPQAPG
jgi:four helix bundle protein